MRDEVPDARVQRELVSLLYADLPLATCAGALLVPVLAFLRWPAGDHEWLVGWAVTQLGAHVVAAVCSIAFRNRASAQHPERWLRRAARLHTVVFALWGMGFAGFILPDAPQVTAVGVAVASFVGAFMLTGVFPTPYAGALNNMLLLLPTALRCACLPGYLYQGLAFLIALNLATAAPRSRRLHDALARSIALRLQNEDMALRLAAAKERAERALQTRSRFVAAASHDLRQPLHAMGLFIDLLAAEPLASRPHAYVERMRSATDAVVSLLQALLELSCIDAQAVPIERRQFALQSLFDELAAEAEPALLAKGLRLRVGQTSAVVDSDPLQLGRIVRNLLSNAVRYSDCGVIRLEVRAHALEVEIRVADQGPGIPEHARGRIFDEFYQAGERTHGGLGLGLSIVQGLARLLDHRVELRSQTGPDSGTCVSVFVPYALDVRSCEHQPLSAACNVLSGRCALVIDDEPEVCDATCALLQTWQCAVQRAQTLPEAIAATQQHGAPDIVICDYQLSNGQTGLDILNELQALHVEPLRTLWVTGDVTPDTQKMLGQTAHPVLLKPLKPSQLRATLTAMLARPP